MLVGCADSSPPPPRKDKYRITVYEGLGCRMWHSVNLPYRSNNCVSFIDSYDGKEVVVYGTIVIEEL